MKRFALAALLLCSLPVWGQYLVPHGPRGSAFLPTDRANLVAWHAGDLGVTSASSAVSTWADQSGNGYDLTAAGAAQPDDSATQNGLTVITFDGTNDEMENSSFADFPDKATIFIVAHQSTEENSVAFLDINNGSATNTGISFLREGGLWEFRINITTVRDAEYTAPTAPASKIWTLWYDGTPHELFENGVLKDTAPFVGGPLSETLSNLVVGALQQNIFHFDGWIAEIVIYSDAADATDRGTVETYLNDKWAIF